MIDYGSFFESVGSHELGLFNCFLWVFAFVFSFIFRLLQLFSLSFVRSFVHSILFFLPTFIIYFFTTVLSLHLTAQRSDYPSHASLPSSTYASHSQVLRTDID